MSHQPRRKPRIDKVNRLDELHTKVIDQNFQELGEYIQRKNLRKLVVLDSYLEINSRQTEEHFHGSFDLVNAVAPISLGVPIGPFNTGVSKLFFNVTGGADVLGTMVVNGNSVDRNTGAISIGDTENVAVNGVTVNTSAADANGNVVHNYVNAYITDKWWSGAITLTSAAAPNDLNCTIETWQITFEQFNDARVVEVKSFDATFMINATGPPAPLFDSYIYSVEAGRADDTCVLQSFASLNLGPFAPTIVGNYRLRRGQLNKLLDCEIQGIFVDLFFGPAVQTYFENFNMKVWAEVDYE